MPLGQISGSGDRGHDPWPQGFAESAFDVCAQAIRRAAGKTEELLEMVLDEPEERRLPWPPRLVDPAGDLHAQPRAGQVRGETPAGNGDGPPVFAERTRAPRRVSGSPGFRTGEPQLLHVRPLELVAKRALEHLQVLERLRDEGLDAEGIAPGLLALELPELPLDRPKVGGHATVPGELAADPLRLHGPLAELPPQLPDARSSPRTAPPPRGEPRAPPPSSSGSSP
jgi:hypothetical protein